MEVVLDFDLDAPQKEKDRWIKAINEGKKIKTEMSFFGDGDFNSIFLGDDSVCGICFNTNTCVELGNNMGMIVDMEEPSEEEMEEIVKDLNENGVDNSYHEFLCSCEKSGDFV